jgi:hypothetical protein
MYWGGGIVFKEFGVAVDITIVDVIGFAAGVFVDWPRVSMITTLTFLTVRVIVGVRPWEALEP